MRVALIGANGQLGTDLLSEFRASGDTVIALRRPEIDVCRQQLVRDVLTPIRPDLVVNTTAFHKVEECEAAPERAFAVNAIGVASLARICSDIGALLVHFSTDYVFRGSGSKPFTEEDATDPVNVYGASKRAGESLIECCCERQFIVRTSGLYGHAGSSGKGGNFVENMIKKASSGQDLRMVDDQVLTPTATRDLARAVPALIETKKFGTYHLSCEGQCSWYEFACEILQATNAHAKIIPVSTAEMPSPVNRPSYSVLSKNKAKQLGITMPHWKDALHRYLRERAELTVSQLQLVH